MYSIYILNTRNTGILFGYLKKDYYKLLYGN